MTTVQCGIKTELLFSAPLLTERLYTQFDINLTVTVINIVLHRLVSLVIGTKNGTKTYFQNSKVIIAYDN